jgi:beta-lactamase class A
MTLTPYLQKLKTGNKQMANLSNIQKQFLALEAYGKCALGVSALHIETNQAINFNAEELFLMCSTYKVAIAIFLLHKTEKSEVSLNDMHKVSERDFLPGMISTLNQLNYDVPQELSIHSLLKIMLQESCNSATAIILNKIGGPEALDAYFKQIGIKDIGMDYYTFDMFAKFDGITHLPENCSLAQYAELERTVPIEVVKKARAELTKEYEATGESCAKPQAMTALLVKLGKQELLSATNTELLLKIMRGCKRGQQRLIRMLPPKTPIAHKTGTLPGYTCDIGIITLPHQMGHIAITAFIKKSLQDLTNNERILAEVGRSVYDFFLFS